MRTITRRFAWIGGIGLLLIILAGSYLISDWRDFWGVPDDVEFTSLRYGVIFIIKMTLLVALLAVVGAHSFVVGPRLIDAIEGQAAGDTIAADRTRQLRMWSMALSISGLVIALAMMVLGTMLATGSFSLQDV
jgi:hypothetical protein